MASIAKRFQEVADRIARLRLPDPKVMRLLLQMRDQLNRNQAVIRGIGMTAAHQRRRRVLRFPAEP